MHGHSSDSSAQKLLYGQSYGSGQLLATDAEQSPRDVSATVPSADIKLTVDTAFLPYETNFEHLCKS